MEEKLKRTWNLKAPPTVFAHGRDPLGKGDIPLCEARNREDLQAIMREDEKMKLFIV